MAGKTRHLLERSGRYYARVTVPERARKVVGKRELKAPLGADRRAALRALPAVVATFQQTIANAINGERPPPGNMRLISPEEIARLRFQGAVAFDNEARNADPRYASGLSIDEGEVSCLRKIASGFAMNDEIDQQLGFLISLSKKAGLHQSETGTVEWRELARWLALAELEQLKVAAARDEGELEIVSPEVV